VIRIGRSLEIFQVTGRTSRIRAGQVEIAVCMALPAGDGRVCAGQRKSAGGVIELRIEPRIHSMALLARGRELGGHVTRIRGLLKSLRVAGVALGGETLKLANCGSFMAGIAFQCRVRADQRESVLVVLY
jgi:hypothetical protein